MMKASDLYRESPVWLPVGHCCSTTADKRSSFFGKLFSETEKREATSDRPYNAGVLLWDFGSFLKTVKIALWFDAISRHLRSTLKSPLFICYRALQFGTGVKTGKVTPRYERSVDYRLGVDHRGFGSWSPENIWEVSPYVSTTNRALVYLYQF